MTYIVNYEQTLQELKNAATDLLTDPKGHFYQTQDHKKLFNKYLSTLVAAAQAEGFVEAEIVTLRQSLNCSHCHRFMSRAGGVVFLDHTETKSVYWNPDVVTDPVMKRVVAELKRWVEASRIKNVYDVNGSYATYTEETHNAQDRHHFYINQVDLRPRSTVNGVMLEQPHKGTFFGRMQALIKFAQHIKLPTLMTMDQWFQTKLLTPVGDSLTTMRSLKALLTTVATFNSEAIMIGKNTYERETALLNLIWRYALSDGNLLTAKNSILGQTLEFLQDLNDGKSPSDSAARIQGFYKEQTSGIKYQRTTRVASVNQVEVTRLFLEENNWLPSLEQQEALEAEIPVLWASAGPYSEEKPVEETVGSTFAAFADKQKTAAAKQANNVMTTSGLTDVGYFFNEILPHIASWAIVLPEHAKLMPSFLNRMKDFSAKPIFRWDREDHPGKFTMYAYEHAFPVNELMDEQVPFENGRYFVNVLSVTTPVTLGIEFINPTPVGLLFNLDGVRSPVPARPALFASNLVNELYDHRRALEDYSRSTTFKPIEGQPVVSFTMGARNPHQPAPRGFTGLEIRAKYTPEYAAIIGAEFGVYHLDLQGYIVPPDLSKYAVLTPEDRSPKKDVVEEPSADEDGLLTMKQADVSNIQ